MKRNRKEVDDRQRQILQYVQEQGEARSEEIASRFGVSLITVRRDLKFLEDKGMLQRTHGGAATIDKFYHIRRPDPETSLCRDSISKYAAGFVQDGDTIFINGSCTALNLLRYVNGKNVTVITNNGWAIEEQYAKGIQIRMTGGELRERILVGEWTMQSLLDVRSDRTFIGCAAVYDDAEFRYDIPTEIGINEIMIGKTHQDLFILADHTKLHPRIDRSNTYGSCRYERPYTLITDELADPEIIEHLRSLGTNIIVVPVDRDSE